MTFGFVCVSYTVIHSRLNSELVSQLRTRHSLDLPGNTVVTTFILAQGLEIYNICLVKYYTKGSSNSTKNISIYPLKKGYQNSGSVLPGKFMRIVYFTSYPKTKGKLQPTPVKTYYEHTSSFNVEKMQHAIFFT